jgi:hypothetical protein
MDTALIRIYQMLGGARFNVPLPASAGRKDSSPPERP